MPGSIRAFIALDIGEEVRQQVRALQEQFRQARAQIKWVEPESCHLTLKFLGKLDEAQLAEIDAACERVGQAHAPFWMGFQGLGAFPNFRNLQVVWMGISEGEQELIGLQRDVESAVDELGFPADSRMFQPHLTLGRLKQPLSRAQMLFFQAMANSYRPFHFGLVGVTAFNLMRSVLTPEGPIYTLLQAYPLLGAAEEQPPDTEAAPEDEGMFTLGEQPPEPEKPDQASGT